MIDRCPICAEPFKPDDNCATDIELGTCHFDCLDGSPVVDLETGEELPDQDMHSYPYSEVMDPSPASNVRGDTVAVPREIIADLYRFFHQAWEGTGRITAEGSYGKDLLDWRQVMSSYHRQTPAPQSREVGI